MNENDRHISIWSHFLRIVEQIVEPQKFATWFKPVRPVSIVDSTLTVEVPSDFFREYLEATYLDVIKKTLKRVITFPDHSNSLYLGCPIILAAGANKTAKRICDYANMGFGGITVGTATRKFREGNTHRPRIGFLENERAIHNSMGLNNEGVEVIARRADEQLTKAHKVGLCVGVSVAETPGLTDDEEKLKDLLESFAIAYKAGDFIEINLSCPNTGESRVDMDLSLNAFSAKS
jgi:hypothetical protein